ncbi:uncharacterized protein LOC116024097 [Ipomoea triloba]|uniref:uncharacterized protein LOC116024097 n=1 Tax=Ipomoea triloba TaxID=35885 RepID=UPI00125D39BD|nr:uncharacterized protein LOC116024097 [Ipomoea triloba]
MVNNNQRGQLDMVWRVAGKHPPFFAGQEDPMVLENWIHAFNKILEVVECPEGRRVEIASFYLQQEADLWWVHEDSVMRQEPKFIWESFKGKMRAHFYLVHVKAVMQEEFLHLKQGSVPTEESKTEKFVVGLNLDTRMALVVFKFRTLSEAYSSATDHYRVLSIRRGVQDRTKSLGEGGGVSNSKRHTPVGPGFAGNFHKGSASGGGTSQPTMGQGTRSDGVREHHFRCRRFGRDHLGRDCGGHLVECYSCGQRGHRASECTSGKGGSSNPILNATQGAQTSTQPPKEIEGKSGSTPGGSQSA